MAIPNPDLDPLKSGIETPLATTHFANAGRAGSEIVWSKRTHPMDAFSEILLRADRRFFSRERSRERFFMICRQLPMIEGWWNVTNVRSRNPILLLNLNSAILSYVNNGRNLRPNLIT